MTFVTVEKAIQKGWVPSDLFDANGVRIDRSIREYELETGRVVSHVLYSDGNYIITSNDELLFREEYFHAPLTRKDSTRIEEEFKNTFWDLNGERSTAYKMRFLPSEEADTSELGTMVKTQRKKKKYNTAVAMQWGGGPNFPLSPADQEDLKKQVEDYMAGVQRYMTVQGVQESKKDERKQTLLNCFLRIMGVKPDANTNSDNRK